MTQTPRNPPAFPFDGGAFRSDEGGPGMSLRDFFAAHAPSEIPAWFRTEENKQPRYFQWRWWYADQMLAARKD